MGRRLGVSWADSSPTWAQGRVAWRPGTSYLSGDGIPRGGAQRSQRPGVWGPASWSGSPMLGMELLLPEHLGAEGIEAQRRDPGQAWIPEALSASQKQHSRSQPLPRLVGFSDHPLSVPQCLPARTSRLIGLNLETHGRRLCSAWAVLVGEGGCLTFHYSPRGRCCLLQSGAEGGLDSPPPFPTSPAMPLPSLQPPAPHRGQRVHDSQLCRNSALGCDRAEMLSLPLMLFL